MSSHHKLSQAGIRIGYLPIFFGYTGIIRATATDARPPPLDNAGFGVSTHSESMTGAIGAEYTTNQQLGAVRKKP